MRRIALGVVLAMGLVGIGYAAGARAERADRYFELRTYTTNAGKMPALHARFRDHTMKLFEKHGITNIGYWSPETGENAENTLVYIIAYPNKESRKKMWDAFAEDPDWKKAKGESEKDGVLVSKVVSTFMNPTEYSPIK